jgi:hypothetical protein
MKIESAVPEMRRDLHNLRGAGFAQTVLAHDEPLYSHQFSASGCIVAFMKARDSDSWVCMVGFPDRPDELMFLVPVDTILGFPQ